jgi:ribonucleoside-diphosphate reductase alpha chain
MMPGRSTSPDESTFDLPSAFAARIWSQKYRLRDVTRGDEQSAGETWRRVADAVALAEPEDRELHARRFFEELSALRFLPGGRILAGAGTGRELTLLNCFVLGIIEDSIEGIFRAVQEAALTMQRGGGVGLDFSTLRPKGTTGRRAGTVASGPVPFMEIFDTTCKVLLSTSVRRGAMMATLRCDHPDIEEFLRAKASGTALPHFNCSVQVSDAFMAAVEQDDDWRLVFPAEALVDGPGEIVHRPWTGSPARSPVGCWLVCRHGGSGTCWSRMRSRVASRASSSSTGSTDSTTSGTGKASPAPIPAVRCPCHHTGRVTSAR